MVRDFGTIETGLAASLASKTATHDFSLNFLVKFQNITCQEFVKILAEKQDKILDQILTFTLGSETSSLQVEPPITTPSITTKKSLLIFSFSFIAILLIFLITVVLILTINFSKFVAKKIKTRKQKKETSKKRFDSCKSLPAIPTAEELEALSIAQNRELINHRLRLYTFDGYNSTC